MIQIFAQYRSRISTREVILYPYSVGRGLCPVRSQEKGKSRFPGISELPGRLSRHPVL